MTFLYLRKAALKISPFSTWVVQIDFKYCLVLVSDVGGILTSSMHLTTFSSLKDFTMKYFVSFSSQDVSFPIIPRKLKEPVLKWERVVSNAMMLGICSQCCHTGISELTNNTLKLEY
jgi:hypothetical protein